MNQKDFKMDSKSRGGYTPLKYTIQSISISLVNGKASYTISY